MVYLSGDLTVDLRARSGDRRELRVPRARYLTGRLRTQETGEIRSVFVGRPNGRLARSVPYG